MADKLTPWYRDTLAVAAHAHRGQVDKAGRPYIEHIERVAARLVARWPDTTPEQIQVALLHDVIEDGRIDAADLCRVASNDVLVTVHLLTNRRTMSYLDYIRTIADSGSVSAIRVKLADNEDNSDPARVHEGAERMLEKRYRPARAILEQALAELASAPNP